MRFVIITHLIHKHGDNKSIGGYAPYIKEMNLWLKHVDDCVIVAPLVYAPLTEIDQPYAFQDKIHFCEIPAINFLSLKSTLLALGQLPFILVKIGQAMRGADHIHLRCPGNVGLIGSLVQILFPSKRKTAKYAGNWDPKAIQPWSYRFQKRILSNSWLTRNMKVLVYGEWPGQSRNILPFFTASYAAAEIEECKPRPLVGMIRLVFIGTLTSNKNPQISIQLAEHLVKKGVPVHLDILGDGSRRDDLEQYVKTSGLQSTITFHGNVSSEEVKRVLKDSHFLIFLSDSEGWPKAVAEAMFWGCVPIVQPVSCVPWMLGFGQHGILVDKNDLESIIVKVAGLMNDDSEYLRMSTEAMKWARVYTLEKFEAEIIKLL